MTIGILDIVIHFYHDNLLKISYNNYIMYRLHDGGFTMPTDNGEPAPPTWINWIFYVENIIITEDTNYSGN